MRSRELVVDSFAGGGGASLGISWALGRGPDIAINHDREAIAMHAANHPESRHYVEDVWEVDPIEATGGQPVGLMWLSPDCKHFSKAKGGKPRSKRVRGLAWVAHRWAKAVRPRVIVLENVEEFQTWGPLVNGRPCPERKGSTFRLFVRRLEKLGYDVQWRELRACDYGAPTIRKRFFLIARCDGQPIVWPKPTHGRGRAHPWRTAAECIDWSISCPSIFERSRPLAENTLRRIARGIRRFVIESPRPFIVGVGGRAGQSPERDVHQPYQTITAKADAAVVVPYLTEHANGSTQRTFDIAEPLRTQCANIKGGHFALVAPTLAHIGNGERAGQAPRALNVQQPLNTVVGSNKFALVSAFLAKHYDGNYQAAGLPLFDPLGTVTTRDHHALITSNLVKLYGTAKDGAPVTEPMPTVTATGNHIAEVRAFLVAYYGNDKDGGSLFDPVRTVTTRERFGLVTVEGHEYVIADIGMRMLAPRELFRAQGFPDSYRIEVEYTDQHGRKRSLTKTAQVRMCGNSVVPQLAEAIVRANVQLDAVQVAA